MESKLLVDIQHACLCSPHRPAFCINEVYYTYKQLEAEILDIVGIIKREVNEEEKLIGVIANNDIHTYASILAILFSGRGFVPIHPKTPFLRNLLIVEQAELSTILHSTPETHWESHPEMQGKMQPTYLFSTKTTLEALELPSILFSDTAYLFFTSGSTGMPKGVPISHANLNGFIHSFWDMGFSLTHEDRFLQMFELTFDLSVMSYMVPLTIGACVYPVNPDKIKYMEVYDIMEKYDITFALKVPSILTFLRPYFKDIQLPHLRYSLFCGEALYQDMVNDWQCCMPNGSIYNMYGPTECTIFCLGYTCLQNDKNGSFNGIVSIGKPMSNVSPIVVDALNTPVPIGEKGELCLSGDLLTQGYWKNEEKNATMFFLYQGIQYYKTGDICFQDKQGDYFYLGRIDAQIQLQGFRVELSEIEHYARLVCPHHLAAIPFEDNQGHMQVYLFVEGHPIDEKEILDGLKAYLPSYMIPSKVVPVTTFPFNVNGKIDRNKLKIMYQEKNSN